MLYVNLAGELFRAEAELREQRSWGGTSTKNWYQVKGGTGGSAAGVAAMQD